MHEDRQQNSPTKLEFSELRFSLVEACKKAHLENAILSAADSPNNFKKAIEEQNGSHFQRMANALKEKIKYILRPDVGFSTEELIDGILEIRQLQKELYGSVASIESRGHTPRAEHLDRLSQSEDFLTTTLKNNPELAEQHVTLLREELHEEAKRMQNRLATVVLFAVEEKLGNKFKHIGAGWGYASTAKANENGSVTVETTLSVRNGNSNQSYRTFQQIASELEKIANKLVDAEASLPMSVDVQHQIPFVEQGSSNSPFKLTKGTAGKHAIETKARFTIHVGKEFLGT